MGRLNQRDIRSGLLAFHTFCDLKNIPEDQCAPISPDITSTFISTLSGIYAGSTVANYLNTMHAWHTIHGLPWALNTDESDMLLKAAKSLAPISLKWAPREPFTVDIIVKLCHLDLSKPLDATVFACLTTVFFTTTCVGEFTVHNLTAFNPTLHIMRSHVSIQCDRSNHAVTNFHLPKTKFSPSREDVNWAKQDGPADPLNALNNHFLVNNPLHNHHLFTYIAKDSHRLLTHSKFLKMLDSAAKKANITPSRGMVSSTLEYLLHNIPFDVIKVKGRWASDAFLIYLH